MLSKKSFRLSLIALLVALSLFAALLPNTTSQAQKSGSITIWCMNFDPHVNGWKNVIAGYTKKNPNVQINLEPLPGGPDLLARYKTALASKQGADIFTGEGPSVFEWSVTGQLLPLTPKVMSYDEAKAKLFPEYILLSSYNNQLWAVGIPDPPGDAGLIVNLDALQAAGLKKIDKFDSREQLLEYAKKLSAYDGDKLVKVGLSYQESNNTIYFFDFIVDQGGSFWDNKKQEFNFNTKEAKAAMQWFLDLYTKQKVDSFALPGAVDGLLNGLVNMGYMWPEFLPFGAGAAPDKKFGFIMKPAWEAGKFPVINHTDTWSVMIPSYTKNADLAYDVVSYLMSEEGQMAFLDANPGLSPLRSLVFNSDYYKTGKGAYLQPVIASLKSGQLRFYGPFLDGNVLLNDILWPTITNIMNGKLSIDEGLTQMTEQANKHNKNARQRIANAPDTTLYIDGMPPELAIK